MVFKIADFNFIFKDMSQRVEKELADYITESGEVDLEVSCTDGEIMAEQDSEINFPKSYLQFIAFHRKLAEWLPLNDAFVLHSACFDVDGVGIAFAAHSGTGKTTHMNRWQKYLGERMKIVNGDKPIVRFQACLTSSATLPPYRLRQATSQLLPPQAVPLPQRGRQREAMQTEIPYAYGTPWNGKEKLGSNMCTPLKHICFIERSEKNYVEKAEKSAVIDRIFNQVYMPQKNPMAVVKTMQLIDKLLASCNLWIIHCNMDENAGELAYKAIFEK